MRMRITRLQLENFKNYSLLDFEFPNTNPLILIGNNGQGKTNFIEAIAILALSKSFQKSHLKDMVNWFVHEENTGLPEYFRIKGSVENRHGVQELEVFCGKGKKYPKTLKVDELKTKPKDYLGHLRIVLFTPQDLNIIMLSPKLRRRFVDLMISQIDRDYLEHLSKYLGIVKQRNRLLDYIRKGEARTDELNYWDEQLALHGSYILWKRRIVFDELNESLEKHYETISQEAVEIRLRWKKVWKKNLDLKSMEKDTPSFELPRQEDYRRLLLDYLKNNQKRDIALAMTCGGPHREDFIFEMNGRDLAEFGSRGECRSTILALKLAELEYIQQVTGESPVLLFDDVLSELDLKRQKNLLGLLGDEQVIITSTHLDEPMEAGVWEVKEGRLTPCTSG